MTVAARVAEFAPKSATPRTGSYVVHYGDLRTGRLIASIPASGGTWSNALLASGEASFTMAAGPYSAQTWAATPVGATLWAVEWTEGRRIVAAGPIWSKSLNAADVTFTGSGIFSIFAKRRLVDNVPDEEIPSSVAAFGGDLGTIIRDIVEHLTAGFEDGDLPIVLDPPRAGSRLRTYLGSEASWADQRIKEISEVVGGPEFIFEPRLTADALGIEWHLVTGTEDEPQISGPDVWTLDASAPMRAHVREVTLSQDAADLGTTAWATGAGSDSALIVRSATDTTLTAAGFPRLEVEEGNQSSDPATVQAYADGLLARAKRPSRAVTVTVSASYWWGLGARLGDRIELDFAHPVIGRLKLSSRVVAEAGSRNSSWVTLTLADTLAEDLL